MKLFGDFHKMKATGDLKETDSFEHSGLDGAHTSKVSILWHSAFFMVQISHPYRTTRKN